MDPSEKSKQALARELETLRARIAELETRASERDERFQSLFNKMTEGFGLHEIICDDKGKPCDYRFLEVNPAFEALTGLQRDDVIDRTVREILPQIEPYWIETFGAVALTGRPARFENYSSALERYYEVFAYSPAPRQFAVLFSNITERKQAEEETLRAKEEWETTFDTVPDLMAILDTQHRIVRVNKAMADRLGLDSEQCVGLACHEAVHGQDHPPEFCPHALTCQDGAEHQAEVCEARLGGDFLVSTTPLRDRKGNLIGSIHVARDITERKKVEELLRKSLREKDVLLKEIHHRVKNNLQIIHSMLNLQMPYVKDENAIALFKESQNRVFSMALIHEKLYQSESLTKIDVPDYIHKIISNLFQSYGVSDRIVTPKMHIENVSLDINAMIPCALIINELVSNSLKHAFPNASLHDGANKEIRVDLHRDPAGKLLLTVSDNGVGLPEGFEIKKSKSLGLKLVNVLVKQLNGSIQTGAGRAAQFKISLEA